MLKRGMKPNHPGRVLRNLYIEPLDLHLGETADNLGITRKTLSQIINEHQGISAEMALRLAKAFDTTPELWLNMQRNYDLWNAEQKVAVKAIKMFRRDETTSSKAVALKKVKPARPVRTHA